MTRRLPVAEAKRDFRKVLDAAERGETTVITRHGREVAVVGPVPSNRRTDLPQPSIPGGLLGLLGLFDDWETMEEDMAEIVRERQNAKDRPPPEFD